MANHITRSGWNTRGGTDAEHQQVVQENENYAAWLEKYQRDPLAWRAQLTQQQLDNIIRLENVIIRRLEINLNIAEDEYNTLVDDWCVGDPEATTDRVNEARMKANEAGDKLRAKLIEYGRITPGPTNYLDF